MKLFFLFLLIFAAPLQAAEESVTPVGAIIEAGAAETLRAPLNNKELKNFYTQRRFLPAWQLEARSVPATVHQFVGFVRAMLAAHGFSENGYPFTAIEQKALQAKEDDIPALDIMASDITLRLARSLAGQDAVPHSEDHTWPLQGVKLDVPAALNGAVRAHAVPAFLKSLAPQTPAYEGLQAALAAYRQLATSGNWVIVPMGPRLDEKSSGERVTLLAQRLMQEKHLLPLAERQILPTAFDEKLIAAVKSFQETHGLIADGRAGKETLKALNVPLEKRIEQVRINMARLRHSPPDVWNAISVNIPSARLTYVKDGKLVYEAPVVVGRIDRATPLVASAIDQIIVNPSWYIPSSIAAKDILPKFREDPTFFETMGIDIRNTAEAAGIADVNNMTEEDLQKILGSLKQRPGPDNSLGRIKFNFPNRFSIYLHGTPHVELFDKDDRNRSSGCIRLKNPEELFLLLMPAWNAEKLQQEITSLKTTYLTPKEKTAVKVLYWTAAVDTRGRVQFYNDVYNIDPEWLPFL